MKIKASTCKNNLEKNKFQFDDLKLEKWENSLTSFSQESNNLSFNSDS